MIPPSMLVHRACAAILLAACAPRDAAPAADTVNPPAMGNLRVDLTGAGATFPYPLYARWFNEYAQRTDVRINYHSIGSGGGIQRMLDGTVDFGATDAPLTDEELARSPTPITHVPTVLGAVAVTYNLPPRTRALKLSGEVLADIFLGRITRWNDARLIALNPDAPLPDLPLHVVHRTDASGTSYIFSDFLAAVSPQWLAGPGRGKDLQWPAGTGGNGNEPGVRGAAHGDLRTCAGVARLARRDTSAPPVSVTRRHPRRDA